MSVFIKPEPLSALKKKALQTGYIHINVDGQLASTSTGVAPLPPPPTRRRSSEVRETIALICGWLCFLLALLATAAFFITLIVVDNTTLHSKYDGVFTPRSVTSYKTWGIVALGIAGCQPLILCLSTRMHTDTGMWCVLFFAMIVYASLLVSGNVLSAIETSARSSFRHEFTTKFNTFYCDALTVRACNDDDRTTLQMLVHGNVTALQSRGNVTAAGSAITFHCHNDLTWQFEQTSDTAESSAFTVDTKQVSTFLDDYSSSSDIVKWCGDTNLRTSDEHRALPSPFATHSIVFDKYTNEWPHRMHYTNLLLGSAAGALVLFMILAIVADADAN